MREDKKGLGTLGVAVILIALMGASIFAFNEYEKMNLQQDATNVSMVEVDGYEYEVGALHIVDDGLPYALWNSKILGDMSVMVALNSGNNYRGVVGYNYTQEQTFTIQTPTYAGVTDVDIGEYGVAYDYSATGYDTARHCKVYISSNGTYYTSESFTQYEKGVVVCGEYAIWGNGSKIMSFNMLDWNESMLYDTQIDLGQRRLEIVSGGIGNSMIYRIGYSQPGGYIHEYYKLNVATKAVSPFSSDVMPLLTVYYSKGFDQVDIHDDWATLMQFNNLEVKAIGVKGGNGTVSIQDIPYFDNAVTQVYGTMVAYAYKSSDTTDTYTVKLYDIETGFNYTVGAFTTTHKTFISMGLSDSTCVITDYSYHMSFNYTKDEAAGVADDDNATAPDSDDDQTAAEAAQEWISNNWYIVVAAVGATVVAAYVGWKRLGETEYAERMSSFKQVNWGIVIAVMVIAAIGILLLL
jgi:hypothetical protein